MNALLSAVKGSLCRPRIQSFSHKQDDVKEISRGSSIPIGMTYTHGSFCVKVPLQSAGHDASVCICELHAWVAVRDQVSLKAARRAADAQSYRTAFVGLRSVRIMLVKLEGIWNRTVAEYKIVIRSCSTSGDIQCESADYAANNPSRHLAALNCFTFLLVSEAPEFSIIYCAAA